MPLTNRELQLDVDKLAGQRGREPLGSMPLGGAGVAEGTFHDSAFLTKARGGTKMIGAPMPQSGYELRGTKTGILEVPIPEAYRAGFSFAIGAADKIFSVSVVLRCLDLGSVPSGASDDGQIIISTAPQIGTHPAGGSDIDSIRVGLVLAAGVFKLRYKWGTSSADLSLDTLDLTQHIVVYLEAKRGVGANTITLVAYDGTTAVTTGSVANARSVLTSRLHFGGELPSRRPHFGIESPCYCIVSQVIIATTLDSNTLPTQPGTGSLTARTLTPVATATQFLDGWAMTETGDELESTGGYPAWIVGNRAHRSAGVTNEQGGGLYFDGTGAVMLPRAARTRKSNSSVPGHYLELDEWTYVVWLDPERQPWVLPSVERACFTCWATPYAANLGVSSDPDSGSYSDTTRPSEHLRLEIRHVGTDWYVYGYFGDLEPESLKHPSGTVGGSSSTTWPPSLAGGQPPCTWNKPQDDPTAAHGSADGKAAFRVLLGADADATHPMAYKWLVFAQRKFVAQNDASNACAIFVRRYSAAGVLDTGFGEVDDSNADSSGERHPANQSCFSVARLNGNDLSLRPEAYTFSIGAGIGSRLGDEAMSYDTTTRAPCVYPIDDDLVPVQLSDECEAFPYIGKVGCPTLLSKYLSARDRKLIAESGAFVGSAREQYQDVIVFCLALEEEGGSILRDVRGNDVAFVDKAGVVRVDDDDFIETPALVGCYPRPEPSWHGEAAPYVNEYGRVNGIVQRIGAAGEEEIYVVGQAGLYQYDRTNHELDRVGSLPGQGGPGQASIAIDSSEVIHIAGGPGRPVIVTRDRVIAASGIDRPVYPAPQDTITSARTLAGGLTIGFQYVTNASAALRAGFEIDDAAVMQFAIGFWSDALKTRSRPGGRITVQYTAPSTIIGVIGAGAVSKYRATVSGLPLPQGPSAHLVTHWEIYRTDSNVRVLLLERRVPIAGAPPSIVIGDKVDLGEEADYLRDVPPEGMRTICAYDRRLVGANSPEFPRSIWYTRLDDAGAWPPIYRRTLNQTASEATGVVVRRDRAFAFSGDHLYQLLDGRVDADLGGGVTESVDLSPTIRGCGALSQMAVIDDDQNGIYMPNGKTVYLTEGGTYQDIAQHNAAADDTVDAERWLWPTSWDLSDGHEFVGFHDERRRIVGVCGPSSDDPDRRDAMLMAYEQSVMAADGRMVTSGAQMSRVRGMDMTCSASVVNPDTKQREVWFGTSRGYVCRLAESLAMNVDYDWLEPVAQRCGFVLAVTSTTVVRLELSALSPDDEDVTPPTDDVFRGCMLRLYRSGELVFEGIIERVAAYSSWVDVTVGSAHGALPHDEFTIGEIPMIWKSGFIDGGTALQDKTFVSADIYMNE